MDEADERLLREVKDKVFYKKSIGPASAKRLVEIIAALELDREMWAANADEAALLAARQAARIAELEQLHPLADPHLFEKLADERKERFFARLASGVYEC